MKLSELLSILQFKDSFFLKELEYDLKRQYSAILDLELTVSDSVVQILKKIYNKESIDAADIHLLESGLIDVRDNTALHFILLKISFQLMDELFKQCETDIDRAQKTIEDALLNGQDLPSMHFETHYSTLYSLQKLYAFLLKYNKSLGCDRIPHINEFNQIRVALGINAFKLLGCINENEYENNFPSLQIFKDINDNLNKLDPEKFPKQFFIFSKKVGRTVDKTPTFQNTRTYIATDGETIVYASNCGDKILHMSAHNYKKNTLTQTETQTDMFTNKKMTKYSNSNQAFWNSFSTHVIEASARLMTHNPHYRNLKNILLFLGEKRQICAQKLDHGGNDFEEMGMRRERFGVPRTFHATYEDVKVNGLKFYPILKARLEKNLASFSKINDKYYYPPDAFKNDDASRVEYLLDEGPHCFNIIITQMGENFQAKIRYPVISDQKEYDKKLEELQVEYDRLLNWDGKNKDEFVKDLGRLSYSLYRLLPFSLGTSAAVNWLMHSIALHKGLTLGPLQEREGDLPLDLEAFVTLDTSEGKGQDLYAEWFLEHAYQNVTANEKAMEHLTGSELNELLNYFSTTIQPITKINEKKASNEINKLVVVENKKPPEALSFWASLFKMCRNDSAMPDETPIKSSPSQLNKAKKQ